MTKQTKSSLETTEFIKNVKLIKSWFESEEIEVSDFVIGRFAVRLKKEIQKAIEKERQSNVGSFLTACVIAIDDTKQIVAIKDTLISIDQKYQKYFKPKQS